jgi:cytochrome c5
MKKYIVIDAFERNMALPLVFDTAEAATNALVEAVAEVLRIEPDVIRQALNESESYTVENECEVCKTTAWANVPQGRLDVAIFELDTETWRCAF